MIGITGSIAAYKIPLLVRLFVKAGAEVRVVMTVAATDFVSPLTLSTLSKHEVHVDLSKDHVWDNHVHLGRWADMMLIAPLSCNTLAKFSAGICDNVLTAVYFSATCPIMLAPAMDVAMWKHESIQTNLKKMLSYPNHQIIPVSSGELASGLYGEGRMEEVDIIYNRVADFFSKKQDLKEKKALVTAGPTYENLDPVRFIGNYSSGKMGIAIAQELLERGAEVFLILGPSNLEVPMGITTKRVQSAEEMFIECNAIFPRVDIAIMNAAVADYTPVEVAKHKIKKNDNTIFIELRKTKDILGHLGKIKKTTQFLVGFALETTNEKAYARKKLEEKNVDLIVLNSLQDEGVGFGVETNKVTIIDKSGREYPFEVKSKKEVATDIVNTIMKAYT